MDVDHWWRRRIEVRDVVVACVVAAALGATLSWLIFAWLAKGAEKFPFGSLGDWAAAVGTWVIGYGAWKYAREGFEQRTTEIGIRDKQEQALMRSSVAAAAMALSDAICVEPALDAFLDLEPEQMHHGKLRISLKTVMRVAKKVEFSPEVYQHLPLNAVSKVAAMNATMEAVRDLAEHYLGQSTRYDAADVANKEMLDQLRAMKVQAAEVSLACNEINDLCIDVVRGSLQSSRAPQPQ